MANKKGVLMYYDILDQLEGFTDEEFGKIVKALIIYDRDGTLPDFDRSLMIAFNCIKPSIDRNKEEYNAKCEQNRANIQKRWNKDNTNEYDGIQPNNSNTMATDNDIDIDKDNDKDKEIEKEDKKKIIKKKNFVAPTKEEVIDYAKKKDRLDLVDNFYDYFTEGHWVDSLGNKVKNWKQKFITWMNKNPKPNNYKSSTQKQGPQLSEAEINEGWQIIEGWKVKKGTDGKWRTEYGETIFF